MKLFFLAIVAMMAAANVQAFGPDKSLETQTETERADASHSESLVSNNSLRGPFDFALDSCSSYGSCTASGVAGVCVNVNAGCCPGGKVTSGLCSGSSSIKCCTNPTCVTPKGTGTCKSSCPTGTKSVSGYCTGPSSITCCVPASAPTQKPASKPVAPTPTATKKPATAPASKPVAPAPTPTKPTSSTGGIDVNALITSSEMSCFANTKHYAFIIPRGYRSNGEVDTNVCNNIISAYKAGIAYRDAYMFPCPLCDKSAKTQMTELANYVTQNCAKQFSGRFWLDIEGTQYWSTSYSTNQKWYKQLVDACNDSGWSCGVYSSDSQWVAIFGSSSFSYGSYLPLWYPDYDNKASFSGFKAFGGWKTPFAKQYNGGTSVCGVNVDLDYCPQYSG